MAQKMFVFDPQDLVRLLTHYTDGEVPLDTEVQQVGFNPHLQRMVGIEVTSKEFSNDWKPLHIRYEPSRAKRLMTWATGDGETSDALKYTPEAPKRQ